MPSAPVDDLTIYPKTHRLVYAYYRNGEDPDPTVRLDRNCRQDERSELLKDLSAAKISEWGARYSPHIDICDGTYWWIELYDGTNLVKRCSGANAGPRAWRTLIKISRWAKEHPAAEHLSFEDK